MSYESVKLALSPVAWYRNDELPGAVTMIDSSGNALDKPYAPLGTLTFAQPSGVETAPSFSVYSDHAVTNFPVTLGSLLDSRVTFTWEVLFRRTAAGPMVLISRHELLNCIILAGLGGTLRFVLNTATTQYSIDANISILQDSWYHVLAVRNGPTMFLVANGNVVALRTDLTTDPIQVDSPTDEIGLAGTSHNRSFPLLGNSEEYTFYDYALTPAQGRDIYESIVNVLDMQGRADIRLTAILNGAIEPDPVAYPFRHNWSQPVVERLSWLTARFNPTDGPVDSSRQRSGLRRTVEYEHLAYDERLRRQLEARSFAGRKSLVQFEPDKVQVTSLSTSATTAAFSTLYRDFEIGYQVLIFESDTKYEYQTLIDVTDNGIEWAEGLSQDYTRPWLKPVRVALLPPSQQIELETDTIATTSVIYQYLPEDEPLSPRRIVPWSASLVYDGGEVFDLAVWRGHDWSELPEIEFLSDRSVLDSGVGVVSHKQYPVGAEVVSPYRLLLETRPTIAQYLGWLYARAGQYIALWMPTFRQDLEPVVTTGLTVNQIVVSGHEYTELYSLATSRQDLAFVYFDNTYILRRILSAVASGANDLLNLDDFRPVFTNLRWLCFLRRVTLASDELELAWETDSVVVATFAVRDAIGGVDLASPSPSPSRSASPSASASLSISPTVSPSASQSASISPSLSPSGSVSPSSSTSPSRSPSASQSPSSSVSPSPSGSPTPSASTSPSASASPS